MHEANLQLDGGPPSQPPHGQLTTKDEVTEGNDKQTDAGDKQTQLPLTGTSSSCVALRSGSNAHTFRQHIFESPLTCMVVVAG